MMERGWTGVVLAGGRSSRMGRDKALIEWDGATLLDRAIDLLRPHCREVLVLGDPVKHTAKHATVIADEVPGQGPLGGLVTAMKRARYVRMLVLACDLPLVNDRLLVRLKNELDRGFDAAVPRHAGLLEPLAGAYHRHAVEAFEACLHQRQLKMSEALVRVRTGLLDLEPGKDGWPIDLFRNLNAPGDL